MSTWGELKKVERVDWGSLDTWDVAECANELSAILLWVVDDERATALLVTAVPQLSLSGSELARSLNLVNVWTSTDGGQKSDSGRCLCDGCAGESGGRNNERDLWDARDTVTAGEEKSSVG